jgi:GTPase SAR1 family protein
MFTRYSNQTDSDHNIDISMDRAIDLRSKCQHFRILVIGRTGAGKTTILKKVCNSIEDPIIFDPSGKPVSVVTSP